MSKIEDKENATDAINPKLVTDVQQKPSKNLNETDFNVDSSSSLALHTISPRPKRLKLMSKIEDKENATDAINPKLVTDVQQKPSKNLNETDFNVDSSSSLALHTISPRPKRLKLMSKIEDKENATDAINLEPKKESKLKTKNHAEYIQENLGNSSSSLTLHSNSPPLEDINVMNNDKQETTNLNTEIVEDG